MDDMNQYMEEFKTYSLEEKRKVALDQLKIIASLANIMCEKLNVKNEVIITKDILEAHENTDSDDDFVEGIVVYANSIQESLCDFMEKMTSILEEKSKE